jgi:cytochrome c oxidase cbb3-type subunit 1
VTGLVDRRLVKAHLTAAFVHFFLALAGGLLYALQFMKLYPFPTIEWLSPGRVRMLHTNAVGYGFLINGLIALVYWIVPRVTGHPPLSRRLSWLVFWAWQLVVLAAVGGILAGRAQAVEWGETPIFVDPFLLAAVVLLGLNLATPIVKARRDALYVSLWYFGAMLVWLPLTYAMGNYIPQFFVPGAGGAAVAGLFIHDFVGLTVTPLGWGAMYYFVPVILKRPIWSHTLSMVGFWGLAFFYPLNGVHHFLYSPIPMYAQYGAIMSTIAVEIVVVTVIVNFFMTLRGDSHRLREDVALRWFYTGMVLYLVTCTQCAMQATLTFQKIIHFTDWVVGHAHLVMFGVFGFWILGAVVYLWPRLTGRPWWSERLNRWNWGLSTFGIVLMFIDLVIAGLLQGASWSRLDPWERSLQLSLPYWHTRLLAGVIIVVGQVLQAVNMWKTARAPLPEVKA